MTYTARKRQAAQAKARAKRIKRYRDKVAKEYQRLRQAYLMSMGMMKAALQNDDLEIEESEVAIYRKQARASINRAMAIFARNTIF